MNGAEMESSSSSCAIGLTILETQYEPCLGLDLDGVVILANRAARKLFEALPLPPANRPDLLSPSDVSVSELPIKFFDTEAARHFAEAFSSSAGIARCPRCSDHEDESDTEEKQDFWQQEDNEGCGPFEINVFQPSDRVVSAQLRVRQFELDGYVIYLLSFSKSSTCGQKRKAQLNGARASDFAILNRPQLEKSILRARFRDPLPRRTSCDRRRSSVISDGDQRIDDRMRDALYYNGDYIGYLINADETFWFPNYRGARHVKPIPISNIDQLPNEWNIWDQQFTRRLEGTEFPLIRLNRDRKNVESTRWGMILDDGSRHVFEAAGECLLDPDTNEYIGYVLWSRDLGEYNDLVIRELEAELGSFEMICDSMPHMVWTSRVGGVGLDYFSRSWYEFTGLTPEESEGHGWATVVHPDDLTELWSAFAEFQKRNVGFFESEARYRRHDGVYRWMAVRVKPLIDEQSGEVLKWYGTLTDKDAFVMLRNEARRINKHMMNVLAHCDITLFAINTSWQVTMLEGKLSWAFGPVNKPNEVSPEHTALENLKNVQQGGVPGLEEKLREVMTGKVDIATTEDLISGRWIRTRIIQDIRPGGSLEGIIGCFVDMTDLHEHAVLQAENARLIAEEQMAKENSRLKSQFLAHMSHEIRTPIAGVIGISDLLAATEMDKEQGDLVDCIHISAHNLLSIVNDILDFSKVEAGQMRLENIAFNLSDLTHDLGRVHSHTAQQQLLDFIYASNIPEGLEIMGNPGRIRQILSNLLTNAIKFTSQGSITLSVSLTAEEVQMTVEDTGIGMDEETQKHLFEPFRQGDPSTARLYGGTGLGLVICQNLAQLMRGRIDLKSTPHDGTRATFMMPLIHAKPLEPGQLKIGPVQEERRSSVVDNSDTVVLVVEDNPINRKIALSSVNKLGYKTAAACNGEEALKYLQEGSPVDVILMDVQMPILDGYQATRKLRTDKEFEHVKDLPIIALTASAIKGDQEKCQEAGMDDYLTKPYPLKMLREKLSKWTKRDTS